MSQVVGNHVELLTYQYTSTITVAAAAAAVYVQDGVLGLWQCSEISCNAK